MTYDRARFKQGFSPVPIATHIEPWRWPMELDTAWGGRIAVR